MLKEIQAAFWNSDLVLADGQGNYDPLGGIDRPIWVLLQAKYPIVAGDLEIAVGEVGLIFDGKAGRQT